MQNYLNDLFVLGDDFLVILNRDWISTHKALNEIIARDKGSEGDYRGDKKLQARREFTFIYHFVGFRSKYRKYGDVEREMIAKVESGLPPDYKHLKDEKMVKAILCYVEIQESLYGVDMIKAAYRAGNATTAYLKGVDYSLKDDKGALLYKPKEVVAILGDIRGVLSGIRELEDDVVKEENQERARGGVRIGNRELTEEQKRRV